MCSLGSSSTNGVGVDKRLAIGSATTLGSAGAPNGPPAGMRQTILGGSGSGSWVGGGGVSGQWYSNGGTRGTTGGNGRPRSPTQAF